MTREESTRRLHEPTDERADDTSDDRATPDELPAIRTDGGLPPGFEKAPEQFPDAATLPKTDREKVAEHRASLADEERERAEQTATALFDLLGRAHALTILWRFSVSPEPLRFRDLKGSVDASPNTLSARLSEFVDAGLLDRVEYDEVPPRVEYEPTERAEALFPAFGHVELWAETHGLGDLE